MSNPILLFLERISFLVNPFQRIDIKTIIDSKKRINAISIASIIDEINPLPMRLSFLRNDFLLFNANW